MPLRAVKTAEELRRVRRAADIAIEIIDELTAFLRVGVSELEIAQFVVEAIKERGIQRWDGPIVGFGGVGYSTHREPSNRTAKPGDQFMIDFGVDHQGFMSDISRTFYFLRPGESQPPAHLRRLFETHNMAIQSALDRMKPGVTGWEVDQAAREIVVRAGYPQFEHALGHQIGRLGHDGGTRLAPRWETYGETPYGQLLAGEIYTLEPTIITEDGLVCQREEEVLVTSGEPRILTRQQSEIICVRD
jgi:Xaa-Pro aminopeptidase